MTAKEDHTAVKAAEDDETVEAGERRRDVASDSTESIMMADMSKDATNPSMELNVAYQALEHVRQANVAIEFGGQCIDDKQCVPCLRESNHPRRWVMRQRAIPCLTCGTPVCSSHCCRDLSKENISICTACSKFFSFDFLVRAVDDPYEDRRKLMNSMLDVYDRALLILRYSSQYIDQIATSLKHSTKRNNRIGFGSSATGLVSGITGVAAAATIWTPVGPPLLLASILFGGGATAVSASSEAVNYRSEPNKMADRIIVLHGMVHSISSLVMIYDDDNGTLPDNTKERDESKPGARNWTRATMNALKPLTAGALSAASVVMEARVMQSTVQKIRAGNPCEKAETLKTIEREIERLPETSFVAKECRKYFMMDDAELNR